MKRIMFLLTLLAALSMLPRFSHAQVPMTEAAPLVDAYLEDAYATRSRAWWRGLEQQLVLSLQFTDAPTREKAMQNLIYFATHHGDKLNLRKAAPPLLTLYRYGGTSNVRVLALTALHAIGDDQAMRELFREVRQEESPWVRRMTLAVLVDYFETH